MAEKTLAEMTLAEMTLACLCVSGRLTVVTICASHGLSFTERKWFGVIVIRHGLELDEAVR